MIYKDLSLLRAPLPSFDDQNSGGGVGAGPGDAGGGQGQAAPSEGGQIPFGAGLTPEGGGGQSAPPVAAPEGQPEAPAAEPTQQQPAQTPQPPAPEVFDVYPDRPDGKMDASLAREVIKYGAKYVQHLQAGGAPLEDLQQMQQQPVQQAQQVPQQPQADPQFPQQQAPAGLDSETEARLRNAEDFMFTTRLEKAVNDLPIVQEHPYVKDHVRDAVMTAAANNRAFTIEQLAPQVAQRVQNTLNQHAEAMKATVPAYVQDKVQAATTTDSGGTGQPVQPQPQRATMGDLQSGKLSAKILEAMDSAAAG